MSVYSNSRYRETDEIENEYNSGINQCYTSDELDMFRHAFAQADEELYKTGFWDAPRDSSGYTSTVRTDMASAILRAAAQGERHPENLKNHALAAVNGYLG